MAHSHNKHRIVHALGHELSYCLFSCESILAVFENREQEQKLNNMYVLIQVNRNGRAPCWTIGRHKTSFFNLFCLAAARWADDAKACACVVKCLFRRGDAACFRAATAWRSIFLGKTLHSLRW